MRVLSRYDARHLRDAGALDDITSFAAKLCEAPVALVTLLDDDEQYFVGRTGTDLEGTPRDVALCGHVAATGTFLEVPDLTGDDRFACNPLVTGELALRYYAGMPMITADDEVIGTLCILDFAPHVRLSDLQREGLAVLARAAMARLRTRESTREQDEAAARSRVAIEDSERRFRTLADTMPQMVWSTLPDGYHDYYNARWYDFTGTPAGSTDGEGWNDVFHPDDQARAWDIWRHSLATGEPYQIEYRLRHFDGTYRWVLGRALPIRDGAGAITRWFGTCTDIHAQKLAMEEREIISQELSHRIKNIFAVIAGLIQFAARSRPEFAPAATDLRQRITALGRAHDFVRPHSAQSRPSAQQDSLKGLLADLFEPYQQVDRDRVRVEGDDVMIDDRSATPLSLLFHELATNATKYGALSTGNGVVVLAIAADDDAIALTWTERDGPAVVKPAQAMTGFGSQLIEMSAVRQLGGTVTRDWASEGLTMTVRVPRGAFSRR